MKTLCTKMSKIRWTVEENIIIQTVYPSEGPEGCADRLLGRTERAIICQAVRLGIKYREWTESEERILNTLFESYGALVCSLALPKRSYDAVRVKAAKMGLVNKKKSKHVNGDIMKAHDMAFHRAWI